MTFIAVVFGFMVVSILLIHWLTAHFGYRLDYRSLALCAVMAMIVTVGAVVTSRTLTWHYYLKLGLLTLAASAVVTAYDERLMRRRSSLAVAGSDAELVEESGSLVLEKASSEAGVDAGTFGEQTMNEPVKAGLKAAEVSVAEPPVTKVSETVPEPAGETVREEKTSHTEEVFVGSVKPAMSVLEVFSQVNSTEMSETETESESVAGDSTETNGTLKQFNSLDDLLDYAYEQRSKGNMDEAILANQMALERYAEDDYAPYIAIELGNIYKERANYDSAIKVYEKSLNIPSVTSNDGTYQEFEKNLSYLRTVLQVLSKHGAQDTPFGEIPQEYMEEIEADFRLRHN